MRNIILSAVAFTLISAPAMAQSVSSPQLTGSVGYTHLDTDLGDVGAITGRLNAKFNRYLGVEGEASVGISDRDFTVNGAAGRLEHDYDAAVYGVATLPISPNLELFGRAGYGTTSVKAEAGGVQVQDDGESWNYGVGANYFFDGQNGVRADITRRDFTNNGPEIDTYGLGYVRRF